jgi:hypothetical protein
MLMHTSADLSRVFDLQTKGGYFIVVITSLMLQEMHHDQKRSLTLPGAKPRVLLATVLQFYAWLKQGPRKLSLIYRRLRVLDLGERTPLLSKVKVFNGLNMVRQHLDVYNGVCRMENYAEVDEYVQKSYLIWISTLAASPTSTTDQAACTNQCEDTFQVPGIKCWSTFSR